MEKKATVITSKGYSIRVADHMLGDLAKFGATTQRPVLKPTPKEILNMPKKVEKSNLPEMESTKVNFDPSDDFVKEMEPVTKVRKTPVRSKAK